MKRSPVRFRQAAPSFIKKPANLQKLAGFLLPVERTKSQTPSSPLADLPAAGQLLQLEQLQEENALKSNILAALKAL